MLHGIGSGVAVRPIATRGPVSALGHQSVSHHSPVEAVTSQQNRDVAITYGVPSDICVSSRYLAPAIGTELDPPLFS